MKNWTGKIFPLPFVLIALACSSSSEKKPAPKDDISPEVSLKSDNEELQKLRQDIPEETRKSNDRLAEMLKRWKEIKMPPETLRERFSDEIRKLREANERRWRHAREDFQRSVTDRRQEFQAKQKDERDSFLGSKRTSEQRQNFISKQNEARDRFNSDLRDERDTFEEEIKNQRKTFEDEMSNRWSEFRQEFPEYSKLYKEMKDAEEKQREEGQQNPRPYAGWPYRSTDPQGEAANQQKPAGQATPVDVNKGGQGWPVTDPNEFDEMKKKGP